MLETRRVGERFNLLKPVLDERLRRLLGAAEAKVLGHGGVTAVAKATGISRRALHVGLKEVDKGAKALSDSNKSGNRIRKEGGGRKKSIDQSPLLLKELEKLVEPMTRGDPDSPLRWTCKSLRTLALELKKRKHVVSHTLLGHLLHHWDYSLQANSKTLEGATHPDRNAQFEHINAYVKGRLKKGEPVISVDTKKRN